MHKRAWELCRGDAAAATDARHDFASFLGKHIDDDARLREAELIFGELVSNAVRCARAKVEVSVSLEERAILRVVDDGECFTEAQVTPQPPSAESGRGMYIAKTLAEDFNVGSEDNRCVVTAVLHL